MNGFEFIRGLDNLEGAQTEFHAKPQAHVEVVWEKTEHHVMSAEERDEQKRGLGQSPEEKRQSERERERVMERERDRMTESERQE